MIFHTINVGEQVMFSGKIFTVKNLLSLTEVLLKSPDGDVVSAPVSELLPHTQQMKVDRNKHNVDVSTVSNEQWQLLLQRELIIQPLALKSQCSRAEAVSAGKKLGLRQRQVYHLIKTYKNSEQQILSLLPKQSDGGKGKNRISAEQNVIIQSAIDNVYLTKQRNKISTVVENVYELSRNANITPPSESTIRRHIAAIMNQKSTVVAREGYSEAQKITVNFLNCNNLWM